MSRPCDTGIARISLPHISLSRVPERVLKWIASRVCVSDDDDDDDDDDVCVSVRGFACACPCFAVSVSMPGASEQKELATRLVGDAGSSVTLSFERTNKGARYDVAITREPVSGKVAKMPLPQDSAAKKQTAL